MHFMKVCRGSVLRMPAVRAHSTKQKQRQWSENKAQDVRCIILGKTNEKFKPRNKRYSSKQVVTQSPNWSSLLKKKNKKTTHW